MYTWIALFAATLVGLLLLAGLITPLLFAYVVRLSRRVTDLEERLHALEGHGAPAMTASGAAGTRTAPETLPALEAPTDAGDTVASAPGVAGPAVEPVRSRVRAVSPPPSFEELIGVRLYVWIGALALFLAGAFLVKFGVDQGWITPAVRVSLAIVFGTALVITGEWSKPRSDRASAGLSAAGIGVLFAGFYAATSVYSMVSTAAGFSMLALTSLTAVALSLRHGVIVGVVGLVGGYLTPALVGSDAAGKAPILTLYLFVLFAAILGASRRREWWPVAGLAVLGSLMWSLQLVAEGTGSSIAWGSALAVLPALACILMAPKPLPASDDRSTTGNAAYDAAVMVAATYVVAATVLSRETPPWPWLFLGVLGVAGLAFGRANRYREPLAWIAAAGTAIALLGWSGTGAARGTMPASDLGVVAAFGALYAVGAFAVMWGSHRPWRWAALASVSAVGFFLVAYAQSIGTAMRGTSADVHWGAAALVLAAVWVGGTALYTYRARGDHDRDASVGALAAGATAFLALAVPLSLSHEWFAVAWSLQAAALAWLAYRTGFASLRLPAWPLAALAFLDLLSPPGVARDLGTIPVLNWLLFGYGVPIAAFAIGAWHAYRAGDRHLTVALQWEALILGLVMIGLQVHHAFSDTTLHDLPQARFVGASTYGIAWMLYGLVLRRAWRRWGVDSLRLGGLGAIALALSAMVTITGVVANPLWSHASVGTMRLLNWLLYGFGASAMLSLLAARELRDDDGRERSVATVARGVGLGLVFAWVTLAVRQSFHGTRLDVGALTTAENYSYSLAWVLLGSALLVIGVKTRSPLARWASLPIMLLTVSKVFLYDVAAIGDLFRVLSFFALGLSLVALGWVYQRYVFGQEAA